MAARTSAVRFPAAACQVPLLREKAVAHSSRYIDRKVPAQ